jgi:isopenicillin-N epimerase
MRHNHENALRGRDVLCRVLGEKPPAPDDMLGSLASVGIPDRPAPKPGETLKPSKYHDPLQDRLIEKWGIQAPIVVFPPGTPAGQPCKRMVRIAMQVYNTVGQVEYFAQALREELTKG